MIGGLLARLVHRLRSDDGTESDDARFVPSPLDASVRYAHGGGGDEAERLEGRRGGRR